MEATRDRVTNMDAAVPVRLGNGTATGYLFSPRARTVFAAPDPASRSSVARISSSVLGELATAISVSHEESIL